MKRRSTKKTSVANAPELDQVDQLVLITLCERHTFRRWAPRGPRGGRPRQRPCPQCTREAKGLTPAERHAARRRDLCSLPADGCDVT